MSNIQPKPNMAIGQRGVELRSLEDLRTFSAIVVQAGLAPRGMDTPAQIAIAVQMGMEVGLGPMQAIQGIAVINGRPCIWGDAGTALVKGSGLVEELEERWEGEGDGLEAICRIRRKGENFWHEGRFSVSDAKTAKLWQNPKKDPWVKYPKRMLMWRARTYAYRDGFSDVLKGLTFREEAEDIEPRETEVLEVKPAPADLDELAERLAQQPAGTVMPLEAPQPPSAETSPQPDQTTQAERKSPEGSPEQPERDAGDPGPFEAWRAEYVFPIPGLLKARHPQLTWEEWSEGSPDGLRRKVLQEEADLAAVPASVSRASGGMGPRLTPYQKRVLALYSIVQAREAFADLGEDEPTPEPEPQAEAPQGLF